MDLLLDDICLKILNIIQNDPKASHASIGKDVGLAPSAVFERIKKMEAKGIIRGYTADINPKSLDLSLLAFIFVKTDERLGAEETPEVLRDLSEVQEIHHIAGEDCYLIKVRVKDTESLSRLIREKLASIPSVKSTKTTVVLETIKETISLPISENKTVKKKEVKNE